MWNSCAGRGALFAAEDPRTDPTMRTLLFALAATLFVPIAHAAAEAELPALPPVKGVVLEVLDADAFTYLRLRTAGGETWAAVRRAPVKKGAQVVIEDPVPMQNFRSRALDRSFDTIVIGKLAGGGVVPATAALAPGGLPPAAAGTERSQGTATKAPAAAAAKVPKAQGADARTVAEIHAGRVALKDQPVTLRARVVKVNAGILGKTWIHLRDGSGSAADGSDDLVATSKDEPKVGDVVVVKGVVRTDVNLGSGYAYAVLLEDAALQK